MYRQLLPGREGFSSSARAGSRDVVAADAITDNGMRLAERESPLKTGSRKLLPDYVYDMNPLGRLKPECRGL